MDKDRDIPKNTEELRRRIAKGSIQGAVLVSFPQTAGFALSTERGLVYNDEAGMKKPWRQPPRQGQHE